MNIESILLITPENLRYRLSSYKRISANPTYIIGKKPWSDYSSNTLLPAQVCSLDSLTCSFEFATNGTGNFENSITVWITNKKQSNFNDVIFLLVFVFNDVGTDKVGKFVDRITIGNLTMDEFLCNNGEHGIENDIVVFYVQGTKKNLFFDLEASLNYLVEKNYIAKENYVASIELLTSIKWGEGKTVFKNFNYFLNTR